MARPRILVVTNRYAPQVGGAEINIRRQVETLSRSCDVEVATPLRDRDPRDEWMGPVRVHRLRNVANFPERYPHRGVRNFCPELAPLILRGRFDAIHCFPAPDHNERLAAALGPIVRAPVFLSIFDLFDYARLLEQGVPPERLRDDRLRAFRAFWLGRFRAVFAISRAETSLVKRRANAETYFCTVPVEPTEFDGPLDEPGLRRRYDLPEGRHIVLALGRVSHLKGQDVLVRAIPKLARRRSDFVVVIAGTPTYEPAFADALVDSARRAGVQAHVRFTGEVPRADAVGLLRICSIHVIPVRFMNAGAVVAETWAARRPVLQSDRVDPSYVKDGENGFVFRLDDEDTLVSRIDELLADDAARTRMGEAGRRFVEAELTYPQLIGQYLEVYGRAGVRGLAAHMAVAADQKPE
jgi:glycosyltransferase involved in cell wall biosynthesis